MTTLEISSVTAHEISNNVVQYRSTKEFPYEEENDHGHKHKCNAGTVCDIE